MNKNSNGECYYISADEFQYMVLQYIMGCRGQCKIFPVIKFVPGKRTVKNVKELILGLNNWNELLL